MKRNFSFVALFVFVAALGFTFIPAASASPIITFDQENGSIAWGGGWASYWFRTDEKNQLSVHVVGASEDKVRYRHHFVGNYSTSGLEMTMDIQYWQDEDVLVGLNKFSYTAVDINKGAGSASSNFQLRTYVERKWVGYDELNDVSLYEDVPMSQVSDDFNIWLADGWRFEVEHVSLMSGRWSEGHWDEVLGVSVEDLSGPTLQFRMSGRIVSSPVPEPSTAGMIALGACGLAALGRRRKA